MFYHYEDQQKECVHLILDSLTFIIELDEFKQPGDDKVHALTVDDLKVKVSVGLQNIKERILALGAPVFHQKLVVAVSSFQIDHMLVPHFLLELWIQIVTRSVLFVE